MNEIRPVELPEKDLPLRADVSLLGSLVGQMLVEQHGQGLLQQVEVIRKAAILRRETGLFPVGGNRTRFGSAVAGGRGSFAGVGRCRGCRFRRRRR